MGNDEDVIRDECSNPDCRVAETGRCVEGLELAACPNYRQETSEPLGDDGLASAADVRDEIDQNIALPPAATLSPEEASNVLRQGKSRVVAVLGPSDSGKTSLIASLYDLFQHGPVEGISFAGSRTLHAFEESCHNARAVSRRSEPEMNRTPYGDVHFYHLKLAGLPSEDHVSLLLGDRAGEEYLAAADDLSVVTGFTEVSRADVLTVLVDGERLVDTKFRHNLRSDITMVLQALHDGNALSQRTRVALVMTKLDIVSGSEREEQVFEDFNTLLENIQRLFGGSLAEIAPFKIAASPKTSSLQRGAGVSDLLKYWLSPIPLPQASIPPNTSSTRLFSMLKPVDDSLEKHHA